MLQRGWAPPDPRTWAMEDLDSLLSSATSLTQGLVPAAEGGDEASDADAASSSAPEADPLLAVNISTSSSVDAANLQRVLTFLVLCGWAVRGAGLYKRANSTTKRLFGTSTVSVRSASPL